jgi:hypothetical protein
MIVAVVIFNALLPFQKLMSNFMDDPITII